MPVKASLCIAFSIALCHAHALAKDAPSAPAEIGEAVCTAAGKPVNEKGFTAIGGIQQWMRIKGSSCANPVVVVVHGGPGNPSTPYGDQMYKAWEKNFTVVQWDQRGAGKTFGRNPLADDVPLVVDQLRDDGIEVARYAAKRFGKRQVILMGGSWGSALAVHMAKAAPDAFCAYIGSAQLVGEFGSQDSYNATLALARKASDQESLKKLESIGAPPWTDPRHAGVLRRVTRKYESASTEPAPKEWWMQPAEYASADYEAEFTAGEDYSWLQFVGMKGDGIASRLDLYKLGADFTMPVFLVQGEQDLVTLPAVNKRYFESIKAPRKEFVLLPRTGHDPNPTMLNAQFKLLKESAAACR